MNNLEDIINKFRSKLSENKTEIIDEFNDRWIASFYWKSTAVSEEDIAQIISSTGWYFPQDFIDFLRIHNGSQLFVDPDYTQGIDILSIEKIQKYFDEYHSSNSYLKSAYPESWIKIGDYNGFGDVIFIDSEKAKKSEPYIVCKKINEYQLPYNFKEWFELLLENDGRRFWIR